MTLEERRQQRRAALIDAGIELFGTTGYNGTTVRELCRISYVAPRDYYAMFENREDLLVAVVEHIEQRMADRFFEAFLGSTKDPTPERVLDGFAGSSRVLLEDPRAARIAFVETHAASQANRDLRRRRARDWARRMAATMADDFRAAGTGEQEAEACCLALVGAANELASDWVALEPRLPADEFVDLLLDTLRRLLPLERSPDGR